MLRLDALALGRRRVAEGVAVHLDDVGVVKQAIQGGAGQQEVSEERRPLFEGTVGGNDRRAVLVALPDDLVEVDRLIADQRA